MASRETLIEPNAVDLCRMSFGWESAITALLKNNIENSDLLTPNLKGGRSFPTFYLFSQWLCSLVNR